MILTYTMTDFILLNTFILSFIYLYLRTMRTCKLCNDKKEPSEFKDLTKDKRYKYSQTCIECEEYSAWFKETWGGVYAYEYHHTKEEIEVDLERIRKVTGIRNGDDLLAKYRAKRIKNDL